MIFFGASIFDALLGICIQSVNSDDETIANSFFMMCNNTGNYLAPVITGAFMVYSEKNGEESKYSLLMGVGMAIYNGAIFLTCLIICYF